MADYHMVIDEYWRELKFNSQTGYYDGYKTDKVTGVESLDFVGSAENNNSSSFDLAIASLEASGIYDNTSDEDFKDTDTNFTADNEDNIPDPTSSIKEVPAETTSLIGEMKRKNIILENQNALLKQKNDLKYLEIKTNIEKMKIDTIFNLQALKDSSLSNDLKVKDLNVKSKSLEVSKINVLATKEIATETKNQEMTTSLSGVNMSIDNTSVVNATNAQTATLEKLVTATENKESNISLGPVSLDNTSLVNATNVQTATLEKLVTATENKESNISLGSVSLDNTALVEATNLNTLELKKIADTAELKKEHLEFIKDGLPGVKDSKGNVIKPREVTAKSEAENHIKLNEQNTFNYKENVIDVITAIDEANGEDLGDPVNVDDDGNIIGKITNTSLVDILSDILKVDSSVFEIEDKEKMKFVRGD